MSGDIGTAPTAEDVRRWYRSATSVAEATLRQRITEKGIDSETLEQRLEAKGIKGGFPTQADLRRWCEVALRIHGCTGAHDITNPGAKKIGEHAGRLFFRRVVLGIDPWAKPTGR